MDELSDRFEAAAERAQGAGAVLDEMAARDALTRAVRSATDYRGDFVASRALSLLAAEGWTLRRTDPADAEAPK
jgi:hypothetical protein